MVEDKEKRRGEKKETKRSEKTLEMNPQKKEAKFWLMRMRESKILYNLQQKLTQNVAEV